MGQNAVVLLPEFVFVEPPPDGVFFDVQDEFRVALFELNALRLDDRRNAVAAGAHPRAIDFVAAIDERDRAHHVAAFLGVADGALRGGC